MELPISDPLGATAVSFERGSGEPWSSFLANREDVVGYVALGLYLRDLSDAPAVGTGGDRRVNAPSENQKFSYLAAADSIVSAYVRGRRSAVAKADRSTDPLFLLMRSAFAEHANAIERSVDEVRANTSLRSQVVYAAASGVIISLFVIVTTAIPGSIGEAIEKWRDLIGHIGR